MNLSAINPYETPTPTSDAPQSVMTWPRLALLAALILFAVVLRFLPHPWNVTPIGAMAIFGGATLGSKRLAILAPLAALFISDALIGFHTLMPVVYGCYLINVMLGWAIQKHRRPLPIAGVTLLGSVLFFLITNFAMWLTYDTYPHTAAGLAECYVLALPFFRNALIGDAIYATTLFGVLALVELAVPAVRPAPQPAVG